MKTLKNYLLYNIQERFIAKTRKIQPKNIFELRSIIESRLKDDKDADLNDIDTSQITAFVDTTRESFLNEGLFENLDPHNIKIDKWKVSNVENMSRTFFGCKNLTCDLSNWDVSKVESISNMFYECYNFDCNLENWDVSNCKNFFGVFVRCKKFKGKGLEKWNVNKVEQCPHCFSGCLSLDNDFTNWETCAHLKFIDKISMFKDCKTLIKNKLVPKWAKDLI